MKIKSTLCEIGVNADSAELVIQGGNSEIFRVKVDTGDLAVKIYKGPIKRRKRSLLYETSALEFLGEKSTIKCPRLILSNPRDLAIVYDWVDGQSVTDFEKCVNFLNSSIIGLYHEFAKSRYHLAAVDNIFETDDLLNQINHRIAQIPIDSLRLSSLRSEIDWAVKLIKNKYKINYRFNKRTLSLSDIGPHNLVQTNDSEFIHLDFEFFGVDSITKMIADMYCHPMTVHKSAQLLELMESLDFDDRDKSDVSFLLSGIALKWVFIALRRDLIQSNLKSSSTTRFGERSLLFLEYLKYVESLVNVDEVETFNTFLSDRIWA